MYRIESSTTSAVNIKFRVVFYACKSWIMNTFDLHYINGQNHQTVMSCFNVVCNLFVGFCIATHRYPISHSNSRGKMPTILKNFKMFTFTTFIFATYACSAFISIFILWILFLVPNKTDQKYKYKYTKCSIFIHLWIWCNLACVACAKHFVNGFFVDFSALCLLNVFNNFKISQQIWINWMVRKIRGTYSRLNELLWAAWS